jgi:hypothetical protein
MQWLLASFAYVMVSGAGLQSSILPAKDFAEGFDLRLAELKSVGLTPAPRRVP